MLDHISISVKNYETSLNFYDQTLEILGYKRIRNVDFPEINLKWVGYGINNIPYFWITPNGNTDEYIGRARSFHIAFRAQKAIDIDNWHKKCLELGGKDNGLPGPRPEYHPKYYGAFIIDPNGWRIESVFHEYENDKNN